MLMTIPRHTTSSCGTGVSAIFLHWHGLWSGSKHLPQQQQPLSQHITMVGFHFCEQRNSERASFYPHFWAFFFIVFGIPRLSPRARLQAFFLPFSYFQPHHGRILGRISDLHLQHGGPNYRRLLVFWYKKRRSNAPPNTATPAETEGRDNPFIVFFFFLFPWLDPCGNKGSGGWL